MFEGIRKGSISRTIRMGKSERVRWMGEYGRDKFGTYFRDAVGQDYADQRYYNAGMGRFFNVDPGGIKTASPSRPSSWNRYSYVESDPINSSDRHGLFLCSGCGTTRIQKIHATMTLQ